MDGALWMQLTGLGLYMGYIPFNCIFFERMIASFRIAGNVGFLIYIADAYGYLGSVIVMLSKEFMQLQLQLVSVLFPGSSIGSLLGLARNIFSWFYFNKKLFGKYQKTIIKMSQRSAIVIGAGIVGLATARALAVEGLCR